MSRTVTVVGHGEARVAHDSAVLRVAAVHRALSVQEAFSGVSSVAEAIVAAARAAVEPAQIASRDLNVWPAHDDRGRQSGFECRHGLEIRCPSLEVAGPLLGRLVEVAGNRLQVEGVA